MAKGEQGKEKLTEVSNEIKGWEFIKAIQVLMTEMKGKIEKANEN